MRRAGAFVFALLFVVATGCDRTKSGGARSDEKGPRELELTNDTLQIPDSIHVATVRIDRSKAAELEPASVNLRTGDLLRFISNDAGAHAIAFNGEGMSAEARDSLEKSGQMRIPPFLASN
jgi:plastocyanin